MEYEIKYNKTPEEYIKFAESEIKLQNKHIEACELFLKTTHPYIGTRTIKEIESELKNAHLIIQSMRNCIEQEMNKINSRKPKYKIQTMDSLGSDEKSKIISALLTHIEELKNQKGAK